MKRVLLFLATNIAILVVLSASMWVLSLFFPGLGQALNAEGGMNMGFLLVMATIMGMGGAFISLAISKWSAKRMTGAHIIEQPTNDTERWLMNTVKLHAQRAGIGMPEVAIFDSPDMNAFATGMNRNNALVAVSTGLLRNMQREEVEAVVGHEISHVANGDMITLTLIQGVVNTFVIVLSRIVGHLVDKVVFKTERGYGPAFYITSMVAQLVLGILASMIVMAFSRQREFRADAGGAKLAGKQGMISALERLKRGVDQPHLPEQMAAFGVSGHVGRGLQRLFMSHPPLEERIAALQHRPD